MFGLDAKPPRDVADVLESAGLLEVSEYRVIELAHAAWFGEANTRRARRSLDGYFFDYLYRDQVPPWLRAFTREVVLRAREGRFDPADYGIRYAPPTPTMIYLGIRYAVWVVLAVVFILAVARFGYGGMHIGCVLPPCY